MASERAIPRPIPWAAPVTRATVRSVGSVKCFPSGSSVLLFVSQHGTTRNPMLQIMYATIHVVNVPFFFEIVIEVVRTSIVE